MIVQDLMTTDVVTVDSGALLSEAVDLLLSNNVGSVLVLRDGTPAGIVTESDALSAALETGDSLDEITVCDLAHRPVITAAPGDSVKGTARRMADEGVKKVPVLDGIDVVGIITLTDIVWHLSDISKETAAVDAARHRWENEPVR